MSWHDHIADFIAAMEAEGIKATEPVGARLASGELIRFHCEGDGKGRRNGWAILYLDERPNGAYGNYRLGLSRKWHSAGHRSLTAAERESMQREWAQAKEKRRQEREVAEREAARDAADMWEAGSTASPDHGYVAAKSLDHYSLRQLGDKLLVPMYDAEGVIRNLQRIAPDGTKRFLRGGRTDGLFCPIGNFTRRGERACIGEGYATMAAVNRATGCPCIVAFSAKNLPAVARIWWDARPDLDFVIVGDDDAHLDRNLGRECAEAAAREIGARIWVPTREAA